jgi:arylsulfatase A-like enzyme
LPLPDDLRQVHLGYITDFIKAVDAEFFLRWEASRLPGPWCYTVSFHNPHDICKWTSHPAMKHTNLNKYPPLPPNHAINPDEPEIISTRRKNKSYGPELSRTTDWDEAHWRAYLQAYYHMMQHVDAAMGKVMQALEDGGWSENTLVIFSSDHGEGVAAHKWVTKLSLYQESTAVPFIMSFPGKIPLGRVNNTRLVSGYDVVPTIFDYAQVEETANWKLRGYTLREAAEIPDKPSGPEYIVCELFTNPGRSSYDAFKTLCI